MTFLHYEGSFFKGLNNGWLDFPIPYLMTPKKEKLYTLENKYFIADHNFNKKTKTYRNVVCCMISNLFGVAI